MLTAPDSTCRSAGRARSWMTCGLLLAALLLTTFAVSDLAPRARAAGPVFTVYMAPPEKGGSDAHDGLSQQRAVTTLRRVHEVLVAARPATDVEVRIDQGTYSAGAFHGWRFYVPGHTISFMPDDYQVGEGRDGIAGLPVFRNNRSGGDPDGFWLLARQPTDERDPLYAGGSSGLRFYYLQIEHYVAGGVSIAGRVTVDSQQPPLRTRDSAGLNDNVFSGMVFKNLGSLNTQHAPDRFGYGAVVLTNSSGNSIRNSHFLHIENAGKQRDLIHGLYITHFSSQNQVRDSRFSYVSGEPVKVRDRSNGNNVEGNTFDHSGDRAFYFESFCNLKCARDNPGVPRQCASYGNRFAHNRLISGYPGSNPASWELDPPGARHAGEPPCSIPPNVTRLRTAGNAVG